MRKAKKAIVLPGLIDSHKLEKAIVLPGLIDSHKLAPLKSGECRAHHPFDIVITRSEYDEEDGWTMTADASIRFEIPLDLMERMLMVKALRKLSDEMEAF